MNIDEITLKAYVDQEISPAERSRIEAAIAQSSDLQAQVAALKASRLPYQSAFDARSLPPLPDALSRRLDEMVAVASVPQHLSATARSQPQSQHTLQRRTMLAAGMATCFAGGYLLRHIVPSNEVSKSAQANAAPAWVDAVANYQAMYTRATVDGGAQSKAQMRAVVQNFERATQTQLQVPDLRNAGLEFRRAQQLTFSERALLQLAYLPAQGKPAALCALKAQPHETNTPPMPLALHGLQVVTWVQNGLAYTLASELPAQQAMAIAQDLVQGRTFAIES